MGDQFVDELVFGRAQQQDDVGRKRVPVLGQEAGGVVDDLRDQDSGVKRGGGEEVATHTWAVGRYLPGVVVNPKAQIHPLGPPEAFGLQIVLKLL